MPVYIFVLVSTWASLPMMVERLECQKWRWDQKSCLLALVRTDQSNSAWLAAFSDGLRKHRDWSRDQVCFILMTSWDRDRRLRVHGCALHGHRSLCGREPHFGSAQWVGEYILLLFLLFVLCVPTRFVRCVCIWYITETNEQPLKKKNASCQFHASTSRLCLVPWMGISKSFR